MASSPLRVLCVDDSPRLTAALVKFIGLQEDMCPVGALHRADHLVAEVQQTKADIVLLDLTMEGRNPISALRDLTQANDLVRVIVYSGISDAKAVDEAVAAGAWGFCDKGQDPEQVLGAIRRVAQGEMVLPRLH